MPVREVPRAAWPKFFASFSRAHEGWLCTLEVESKELGAEIKAHWLPFAGVDAAPDAGEPCVRLFVGASPEAHVSHALCRPTGVWVEETRDGAESGLRIEAEDGAARVWFRAAVPPDQIDDIA